MELLDLFLQDADALLLLPELGLVHQQGPSVILTGPDEALGQSLLLKLCHAALSRLKLIFSLPQQGSQFSKLSA